MKSHGTRKKFSSGGWRTMIGILSLVVLAANHATADSPTPIDRVSFELSETSMVETDVVIARLYAQFEGAEQSALANEVNQTMRWALEKATGTEGVEVQTQDYRTDPVYREQRVVAWRARQSLEVKGQDAQIISTLIATLQQRLAVEGIRYEASPETRKRVEQALTTKLLGAVQARASEIAHALGRDGYQLVRIDLNANANAPRVAYRSAQVAMADAVAPPALTQGEQNLSVRANVEIELSSRAAAGGVIP
jgi:predicted secreted protein